jgi:hypothetical protein
MISFLPVGIRVGVALQRLDAQPRGVTVIYTAALRHPAIAPLSML